jgi:hypothetical protein
VWRPKNTAYREQHILGTTAFGGGGVTVGMFFFRLQNGPLHSERYHDRSKISQQHHPGYRCASF